MCLCWLSSCDGRQEVATSTRNQESRSHCTNTQRGRRDKQRRGGGCSPEPWMSSVGNGCPAGIPLLPTPQEILTQPCPLHHRLPACGRIRALLEIRSLVSVPGRTSRFERTFLQLAAVGAAWHGGRQLPALGRAGGSPTAASDPIAPSGGGTGGAASPASSLQACTAPRRAQRQLLTGSR